MLPVSWRPRARVHWRRTHLRDRMQAMPPWKLLDRSVGDVMRRVRRRYLLARPWRKRMHWLSRGDILNWCVDVNMPFLRGRKLRRYTCNDRLHAMSIGAIRDIRGADILHCLSCGKIRGGYSELSSMPRGKLQQRGLCTIMPPLLT